MSESEKYVFVSFGAGVNTVALAVLIESGEIEELKKYKNAEYVFADTHAEHPRTYEYLNDVFKPWLAKKGKTLHVVSKGDLINDCVSKRWIPMIRYRICTVQYKIRPIRRFLKNKNVKHAIALLGITIDEYQRMKDSDVKWIENKYPLVDLEITRKDCYEIIKKEGLPIPKKSGCYCCPFQPIAEFYRLKRSHPALFERVLEMEENARAKNPKLTLKKTPLKSIKEQLSIDVFLQDEEEKMNTISTFCDSGHCFV